MDAVRMEVSGLKCDTPNCGYRDESISRKDYESLIGTPCPKCGSSLLTQEDYDAVVAMEDLMKITNEVAGPIDPNTQQYKMNVSLNGNGIPEFGTMKPLSKDDR